jgi:NitT/TauT family transport system substrate-binding protein
VIGLTYIPNIQFAPFYIADHEGSFAPATLRHHGSAEGLFTALTAGDEDFVVAGGDEILQARAQGVDLVAVASYYGQYPARIIVPQGSPIASVADLRGHTVGLPGRYGESWFALLIALKEAGLTESDVTIMEIGYTQQAALTTGKVDAVVGFANSEVLTFEAAGFPVTVIDPQVPLVSICLATTHAYAEAHPDVVTKVIAGMKAGMTTAREDEATTLDIAAQYIPSFRGDTLETAKQVLPATTALFVGADGTVSPPFVAAEWTAMATAMASVGLVPAGTDAAAAYTNAYA